MSTPPYFPFYVHDFLGGRVATYSIDEIGAYSLLLAFDWSLNGIPVEPDELARLCRVSRRRFAPIWAKLEEQFPIKDGRRRNPRLEIERARYEKKSKQARAAADARWGADGDADACADASPVTMPPEPEPEPETTSPKPPSGAVRAAGKSDPPPSRGGPRFGKLVASEDEESVLAHYVAVHPKRRPGEKDLRAVRKALGYGYSVSDLCEAIEGNASDSWHQERKKHELPYVLRDNGKIDDFRAKAEDELMTDAQGNPTPALLRLLAS